MRHKENSINIAFRLYLYWALLLAWQNLRGVLGNRGAVDIIVKIVLLMFLLGTFLSYSRTIPKKVFLLFGVYAVLTLIVFVKNPTFDSLMYYFYPITLYLFAYGCGNNCCITKKDLITFLHLIIYTVGYIVVYALLFCTNQFLTAFSIKYAYGNELKSFLDSNCEYGLYLVFALMAIVLCFELEDHISRLKRTIYILILLVFAANLVLTFSRTAIFMFVLCFFIYTVSWKKGKLRYISAAVVAIFLIVLFTVPQFYDLVINRIFAEKGNSGRTELAILGINLYSGKSLKEQILGVNYNEVIQEIRNTMSLTSFHNAYVQILVTNGIKGVLFVLGVMMSSILGNIRLSRQYGYRALLMVFSGFVIASAVYMATTTGALFYSSIDSYFITAVTLLVPKYVRNAIANDIYE